MSDLTRHLRCLALFEGTSDDQLMAISTCAERAIYQPGDALIAKDRVCEAAILIIDGTVTSADGGDMIGPGALLAEMAMVVDIEASTTFVAQTRVRALQLRRDLMQDLLERNPAIAEAMMDCISGRLRAVADQLRSIDTALSGDDQNRTYPQQDGTRTAASPVSTVPAPVIPIWSDAASSSTTKLGSLLHH